MKLLVVGALHRDVVVRAPRLPKRDETLRGHSVAYQLGGKAGNQAIAAARAGAQVAFAGRVGDDAAGVSMRAELAAFGIDLSRLQQGAGASGMSAAIVDEAGDYGAVIVSAENHRFETGALSLPDTCGMVLLQNEMLPAVFHAAANLAARKGARLVWNAAPGTDISPDQLTAVDTLIVNRVEAGDLLGGGIGTDALAAVRALAVKAPQAAIVLTLGGDGVAFAAAGADPERQPAEALRVASTQGVSTQGLSTHGAGDVFAGTLAACQLQGATLGCAVAAGQKAAAVHIKRQAGN